LFPQQPDKYVAGGLAVAGLVCGILGTVASCFYSVLCLILLFAHMETETVQTILAFIVVVAAGSLLLLYRLGRRRIKRLRLGEYRLPEQAQNEGVWSTSLAHKAWSHRGIRVSIGGALVLLAWDAVLSGSFLLSFMVCPIWFLVSVLKNAIQRPGWRLALLRIAIPVLTLGLVLANNAFQLRIAEANAPRIVAACEDFHAANGKFPKTLDELVPRYMPAVPRAKYCLDYGEFRYWNLDGHPILVWYVVPPFGRKIYDFENRRWNYLD